MPRSAHECFVCQGKLPSGSTAENANYVVDGNPVCSARCHDKASTEDFSFPLAPVMCWPPAMRTRRHIAAQ